MQAWLRAALHARHDAAVREDLPAELRAMLDGMRE